MYRAAEGFHVVDAAGDGRIARESIVIEQDSADLGVVDGILVRSRELLVSPPLVVVFDVVVHRPATVTQLQLEQPSPAIAAQPEADPAMPGDIERFGERRLMTDQPASLGKELLVAV